MKAALSPERWRPAPLLPRGDGRDPAFLFLIAALCFFAGLAAVAGLAGERAAEGWRSELGGSATIVVRAQGGQTPDEAAAAAAEAVSKLKGVTEAQALEKAKADALLAPWIGAAALPPDLPVPRLVTVELDRKAPATGAEMRKALAAAGVDATVDDHSRWTSDLMRAGVLARAIAAALFVLILAVLGAAIAFAARQDLAARRDLVEALHLCGASDGAIAGLFQARFALSAVEAGVVGAALAAAAAALLKALGAGEGLAAPPIAWKDLLAVAPAPVLGALVAALAARATAMAMLAEGP